jgi:acyl-CoA thioester hydrolase
MWAGKSSEQVALRPFPNAATSEAGQTCAPGIDASLQARSRCRLNDHSAQPSRRAVPRLDDFPYVHAEPIRYADMDRQGHVNNAIYSTFLESGRVNLFRDPRSGLDTADVETVLARIEIDYLLELRWPGTVQIGTGVARVGRTSVVLDQAVFSEGACAAVATAVMVLMDRATRRPRPLPEDAVAKLRATMR